MKRLSLLILLIVYSFTLFAQSNTQLKFTLDTNANKEIVKDFCKKEKINDSTRSILSKYVMDWYSVYIKLTISGYAKQHIVKGQESEFQIAQKILDRNVSALLGEDGYKKLYDFLPNAKMQQIAKRLKQPHKS
jgi:hypothetical protein